MLVSLRRVLCVQIEELLPGVFEGWAHMRTVFVLAAFVTDALAAVAVSDEASGVCGDGRYNDIRYEGGARSTPQPQL